LLSVAPQPHEGDDVIAGSAGSRRIAVGVAAAAAALLVLGGCAAGQRAQTAEQTPVVDGVSANAGPIALRAVTVTAPTDDNYAEGGDATLQLVIVNDSRTDDELTGVATPEAPEVRLFANQADAASTPSLSSSSTGSTSETPSATGSTSPSPTAATGSTSETPSATGSTSPSPTAATTRSGPATLMSIALPAGRAVSVGYTPDLPVIQLHGLTRQLFPAQTFPITFTFGKAGAVTFTVAVHLAPGPSATPSIDIAPPAQG
jgi:copper(I)-binding protein